MSEPFLPASGLEPLSPELFERFRTLIYRHTGIHMRESKHILVANRLRRRVLELGLPDYEAYYRTLLEEENAGRRAEIIHFIDAVSTNETYFYRETGHLDALRRHILPDLFSRKRRIRLWSAGCSSGEEPYTLSILFTELAELGEAGEVEVLATDVSARMIEAARAGVYRERSLRFVPPGVLTRHFEAGPAAGSWTVSAELRRRVSFRVHNLLSDPPPDEAPFDLIFCRNVMIYFDKATQRKLVDGVFASVLDRFGYLCIGHSESLSGTSERFRYQRATRAPVYRLAEAEPISCGEGRR